MSSAGAIRFAPSDTLREAYTRLVAAFSAAGLDTPETDARFLMRGVLGLSAGLLLRDADKPIGELAHTLVQAAQRRLLHEPVSRILGEREFFGRAFEITPDVLDPRPDTETLIDEILEIVDRRGWRQCELRIADIGLGSGAILVTLLAELPLARGTGTDVSAAAIACAMRNAERHGVSSRLTAVQTSILNGISGPFDIVVSNPPYIPAGDIPALAPEVEKYDPMLALDGGPDGLSAYREIHRAINGLPSVNYVVLEAGASQGSDVAEIFRNPKTGPALWDVSLRKDLGGHDRCVTLERQSWRETAKTVGSASDTR